MKTIRFNSRDGTKFELAFQQNNETIFDVKVYQCGYLDKEIGLNIFKSFASPHSFEINFMPKQEKVLVVIYETTRQHIHQEEI